MASFKMICEQAVATNIDLSYINECGFNTLAEVYQAEYGYNGKSPKACMDYLQGLPSVCTVPFYNGEIYELLEKAGISVPEDDDKAYDLIEKYWIECGKAFYQLIK